MKEILETIFWGNTVKAWLIALGIIIIAFVILKFFKKHVVQFLKKWSSKTNNNFDDFIVHAIEKFALPYLYCWSIYFAVHTLSLSVNAKKIADFSILLINTYFIVRTITYAIEYSVLSFLKTGENYEAKKKQSRGIILIFKFFIWVFGIVFLLDNSGYDITTIIAGMGIGGIAIALAAQTILGDLFSYFVIFFDRPFEIGDFITVDDKVGTVEYIGIKTTRIRTLNGDLLVCSNKDLTDSRVHNFKKLEKRRVVIKIGVVYQTSYELLQLIPKLVNGIIDKHPNVELDRGNFAEFGDSSLNFEFVYYVLSPDYKIYMDNQQDILYSIAKVFEENKIDFAYPTQTLHVIKQETL